MDRGNATADEINILRGDSMQRSVIDSRERMQLISSIYYRKATKIAFPSLKYSVVFLMNCRISYV